MKINGGTRQKITEERGERKKKRAALLPRWKRKRKRESIIREGKYIRRCIHVFQRSYLASNRFASTSRTRDFARSSSAARRLDAACSQTSRSIRAGPPVYKILNARAVLADVQFQRWRADCNFTAGIDETLRGIFISSSAWPMGVL